MRKATLASVLEGRTGAAAESEPLANAVRVPIRRSATGFCQGDLGEIGRSRIPIARTRL